MKEYIIEIKKEMHNNTMLTMMTVSVKDTRVSIPFVCKNIKQALETADQTIYALEDETNEALEAV